MSQNLQKMLESAKKNLTIFNRTYHEYLKTIQISDFLQDYWTKLQTYLKGTYVMLTEERATMKYKKFVYNSLIL